MPDDNTPSRRPFGERDSNERNLPFGARRNAAGGSDADSQRRGPAPDEPYNLPPLITREPEVEVEEASREELSPFKARPPAADNPGSRFPNAARTSLEEVLGDELVDEDIPVDEVADSEDEPELGHEPPDAPEHIRARQRPPDEPSEPSRSPAPAAPVERAQTPLNLGVILRTLLTIFGTAAVFATVLTWWTPNTFLPSESVAQLSVALATQTAPAVNFVPTLTPMPRSPDAAVSGPAQVVGIVSGHRGIHPGSGIADPGAVCDDGLTEQETVENVALLVQEMLIGHGYQVDLLDEWDPRLAGYGANALISIHADSCEFFGEGASGFKVASFAASTNPEQDSRLVGCMISRYAETTNMDFHPSVTYDMTDYHNFREILPGTPGAIIEIGFLNLDREMLTEHADVVALGVARGVLCYLRNEPLDAANVATPSAEPTRVP